jgi:hypothetical protein
MVRNRGDRHLHRRRLSQDNIVETLQNNAPRILFRRSDLAIGKQVMAHIYYSPDTV